MGPAAGAPRRRCRGAVRLAAAVLAAAAAAGWLAAEAHDAPPLVPVADGGGRPLVEAGLHLWCSPQAEYRVVDGRLVPVAGLFLYQEGADPPEQRPRVRLPHWAEPGAPVRAYLVTGAPLSRLTLTLRLADATELTADGFAVAGGARGETWMALLGVPADTPPGPVEQVLEGRYAPFHGPLLPARVVIGQPLEIVARTFAHEEITLDRDLSALRRTTDPARLEQSRALARLLARSTPALTQHLGPLRLPVGAVRRSGGFGDRRRYRYADGSDALSIHHGVDFAAPAGTPVQAAGGGTVVMARPRIVTGHTVVIEHLPGVYSLYYHLAHLLVEEGQRVSAGEALGTVGSTGLATGPHLHWEVRAGGVAIDPDEVVAAPLVDIPQDLAIMER